MRFVETPVFTSLLVERIDDEEHRRFQLALVQHPELGPVIPRSGGLRKVRWSLPGSGKRGGIRIIYFWDETNATIYLLYLFAKNQQENLTATQLRVLSRLVREEFQ